MAKKLTSEMLAMLFTLRQAVRQGYSIPVTLRDGAFYDELTGCAHLLFRALQILDRTLDDETVNKLSDEIIKACENSQQGMNDAVRVLRARRGTEV